MNLVCSIFPSCPSLPPKGSAHNPLNEKVNIYTHLIGCLAFTATGLLLYSMIVPRYPTATYADLLAFACFFLGVALCLGMSATYHTISNHSDSVAKLGNQLDYVGIVFLITGSFVPSIYYGFYCEPKLQRFYWGMVSCFFILLSGSAILVEVFKGRGRG
jgi:adiponectin receptor